MRSLDSIKVPTARAMIISMVGEYNSIGHILPKMLPTVLKYLARCFTTEALETKLQILTAAVKVIQLLVSFLVIYIRQKYQNQRQFLSMSTLYYTVKSEFPSSNSQLITLIFFLSFFLLTS